MYCFAIPDNANTGSCVNQPNDFWDMALNIQTFSTAVCFAQSTLSAVT
jgi:hypothetical protein